MCFSASSSFTAAGFITLAGIANFRQAKNPRLFGLAAVPLVFASHQLIEGNVWLTIDHPASLAHQAAVAAFVLLGFGVWPVYVPFFMAVAERKVIRRRILYAVAGVELYLFGYVASQLPGMVVEVKDHSLAYSIEWKPIHYALYGAAMAALFVSSLPRAWIAAVTLLASFVTAYIVKQEAAASVWCFFAAVLSVGSFWYIRMLEQSAWKTPDLAMPELTRIDDAMDNAGRRG